MGSFSWNKADKLTSIENIACGKSFKFLIPQEFGGGFIKDVYQDYGYLGKKEDGTPKYDMYELLAFWNKADGLKYIGEYPLMKEIDHYTDDNRGRGIDIGCYDNQILELKYPLKLVSSSFMGTYEDLETCSLGDPDQGWGQRKRSDIQQSPKSIVIATDSSKDHHNNWCKIFDDMIKSPYIDINSVRECDRLAILSWLSTNYESPTKLDKPNYR